MRRRFAVLLVLGMFVAAAFATSEPLTVDCLNGNLTGINFINVTGCLVPGGGTFTGQVTATLTGKSLSIGLTGTFTGTNFNFTMRNPPLVSAPYPFGPFTATLAASMHGILTGKTTLSAGNEFMQLFGVATTFSNNPAIASWGSPFRTRLPIRFSGSGAKLGRIRRPGELEMFFSFNIPRGESVTLPATVGMVPEPGTLSLLGTGLIALASVMRRKLSG